MRPGPFALLLLASVAPAVSAAPPACALLDPDKSPQVAILEAKLLADAKSSWVERAQIDAVLKEQKLQAMFAPAGVGDRVKLGKLLKADVLVMVRPVKDAKEPALEVVVGETAGGLRLAVRAVPLTKDVEADAAALLAAVREGIARHGEAIREVVAVPPFVSNDLEYAHEHLKGALAKLAEAEALGRKGVVVVELAEAEALAKELALADPGAKLDRPLPLYLLGEYRHEGTGKDRTLGLKLRAERGGKAVGKPAEMTVKPDAGSAAVRAWAAGSLDALAKDGTPRPPADPKAEGALLGARALVFKRLGNWEESVALADAALLLDPKLLDLHIAVMSVLGDPIYRSMNDSRSGNDVKATERYLRLYRRGLEHLEAYIEGGGDPARHPVPDHETFLQLFRGRAYYLNFPPRATPEIKEMIEETRRFERALCTRLLAAPTVAGAPDAVQRGFLYCALGHLPVAEKRAVLERLIAELPDAPASASRARGYAAYGFWANDDPATSGTGKEYEDFRARITDAKFKFAAVSRDELVRLERMEAERRAFRPPPSVVAPEVNGVRFTAIKLEIEGPKLTGPEPLKWVGGLLAVGPALDVLWDGSHLYRMKEKGKLIPVSLPAGWGSASAVVIFDGKYVWTSSGVPKRAPILAAFDPTTGKVWDLSNAEGLPQPTAEYEKATNAIEAHAIAPLGPGRICAAGYHGRAWVATVALDPEKGGSAKVVHEAREAPDRLDKNQWKKATVAFTPGSARTIRGTDDGKPSTRVLIGRSRTAIREIDGHSLLVDPDRGTAEVVESMMIPSFSWRNGWGQRAPTTGGMVYFQEPVAKDSRLLRMKLPGPTIDAVATGLPTGTQVIWPEGDRFHAVEHLPPLPDAAPGSVRSRWFCNWWIVEPGESKPRLAGTGLPSIGAVAVSSHYGLVAVVQTADRDPRSGLCTVEAAVPPKGK